MRVPPSVTVVWLDAHQLRGEEELTLDEAIAEAHGPLKTTTVGHLLRSDSVGITLATDVQNQEDELSFRGVIFIPRGMVVRESTAGRPRKKKAPAPDPQPTEAK